MSEDDGRHTDGELIARIAEATAEAKATRSIVAEKFTSVQNSLNLLTNLPSKVAGIQERLNAAFQRIEDLERDSGSREQSSREWWRSNFPAFVLSVGALIVSLIIALHQ